jgi:hypothetical protein
VAETAVPRPGDEGSVVGEAPAGARSLGALLVAGSCTGALGSSVEGRARGGDVVSGRSGDVVSGRSVELGAGGEVWEGRVVGASTPPGAVPRAATAGGAGVVSGAVVIGTSATGIGATGIGATGIGATGIGATGIGATGIGATGIGATGTDVAGTTVGRTVVTTAAVAGAVVKGLGAPGRELGGSMAAISGVVVDVVVTGGAVEDVASLGAVDVATGRVVVVADVTAVVVVGPEPWPAATEWQSGPTLAPAGVGPSWRFDPTSGARCPYRPLASSSPAG